MSNIAPPKLNPRTAPETYTTNRNFDPKIQAMGIYKNKKHLPSYFQYTL